MEKIHNKIFYTITEHALNFFKKSDTHILFTKLLSSPSSFIPPKEF